MADTGDLVKKGRKGLTKQVVSIQRQLLEFQKTAFDGTFDAVVSFQDKQEKLMNDLLERVSVLPDEGKQIVDEWIETYKKGREDFRDVVERSYDILDDYFDRLEEESEEEEAEEEAEGEE